MSGRDTTRDLQDAPVYGSEKNPTQGMDNPIHQVASDEAQMLNPDFARKLGREIYASSTNWLNSGRRLKWNDSLRAFQGLHPSNSKYLSTDYRYRSRLFRPKTRAMVRKAEASTAQAFFGNEDVVSITAQDDNDKMQQASAEFMQRLLQFRLTKTIPWFLTLIGARQDAEVMGICLGKAYWKYSEKHVNTESRPKIDPATGQPMLSEDGSSELTEEYDIYSKTEDHPWVDLISPENFRFDSAADWRNPIATSPYTIEMIPMYIADVQAKIKAKEWNYVSESALFNATDLDDDATRRSREQGRVPGKDHDSWKPRPFDICWVRENIVRYNGTDWHFLSIAGGGELLTNPKPLSQVYLQGIRPYVCGFVLPEAHKVYPTSKCELIKDLQTQVNDVTNLRLDNVKLALNPRQFIKAGQGIDPQDMRTFMPAKVVITSSKDDPRNAIMWDRPPDVTAGSFQEHDRLNMDFDELVGGTSNSSLQANPQAYKTVGNMELMDGNASVLEEYDQRVFSETFVEPLIRQLVKLEQAYETDPVVLAIAGREANLIQKFNMNHITDELLKQELTIRVNVGLGATNPKTKLQNFLTGTQAIGQMFGPAAAMGANFEEVTKEVFSLCGYKDGSRFFMPGFDIHQTMQQMSQGKGKQQEDPQGKIAIAQATQQAQAQQDAESHRMEMQEMQMGHQFKMEEMMQKFQLEMQKAAQKQSPAISINSDALSKTAQDTHNVAQEHHQAIQGLGQLMGHMANATLQHGKTLEQMLSHNAQSHAALAGAVDKLAQAHMTPKKRKVIRDEKGKLIGAEEYV